MGASEASDAYKALLEAFFKAIGTKVGRRSSIAFVTADNGVFVHSTAYAPIDRDHMDPDHRARFDETWATIRALAERAAEHGAETKIRTGHPLADSEYFELHQDTLVCASYYPPMATPKRPSRDDDAEAPPAKRPASDNAAELPLREWLPTCPFAKRKDPERVEEYIAALLGHGLDTAAAIVRLGLPMLKTTLAKQIPPITVVQIFNAAAKTCGAVAITYCSAPPMGYIDFKWAPLDAPGAHRAWAEDCFEKWSREELDDLLREHRARRLGVTGSIPHYQAKSYYGLLHPEFDALCALFTEVCTAIAQYAAANEL